MSYAARTARAQWLLARAAALRGDQPASRLSDLDWRGTLQLLGEAEAVARQALRLSVNPLTAWLLVGQARNLAGGQLSLDDVRAGRFPDWYVQPLAHNPRSLALRQVMLGHLRPEWGGSDEQMFTFVRGQEQEERLGAGDRHRLWADYHAWAAHHTVHFAGDLVGGVERARLAADLYEPHSAGLFAALTRALAPDAERQRALERFLDVAELNPALRLPPLFGWALYNSDRFLEPLLPRVTELLRRWAIGSAAGARATPKPPWCWADWSFSIGTGRCPTRCRCCCGRATRAAARPPKPSCSFRKRGWACGPRCARAASSAST
ncbi:hypothetical protein ACXXDK_04895 [Deinococcus sp. PESE-38]